MARYNVELTTKITTLECCVETDGDESEALRLARMKLGIKQSDHIVRSTATRAPFVAEQEAQKLEAPAKAEPKPKSKAKSTKAKK